MSTFSSYSISKPEKLGTARIDQVVSQTPLILVLEIDSPDDEAENVERGDILTAFGTKVHVRDIMLRDKATDVYRFRVEVSLFMDDLRTRAVILRAYETQEVESEIELDPIPF